MRFERSIIDVLELLYNETLISKGLEHIKTVIGQDSIGVLIYLVKENEHNKEVLLNDHRLTGMSQKEQKSIAYSVMQNDPSLQQLFFILLVHIYRNNYAELTSLTSSQSPIHSTLLQITKTISDKIPVDKVYSVYFFDSLKHFITIHENNIP